MFARLARFLIRHRRPVLIAAGLFFVVAGALGGTVADHLSRGGFDDPRAESVTARQRLERDFGAGLPAYVLVVTPTGKTIDDPVVADRARRLTGDLAGEAGVADAISWWTTGAPDLRGKGNSALVVAFLTGSDDQLVRTAARLNGRYLIDEDTVLTTRSAGWATMFDEVGHRVERDLKISEAISLPIVLVLLVLIFGGLVAAGVPLAMGLLAIVGTFLVLRVLAAVTEVAVYSLSIATALGLGLAIDYGLLLLSRYREEFHAGRSHEDAIVAAVATAGRTIVFSGLTVAVSISALLIFPVAFLRSFAYAGYGVLAVAVAGAVLVMPAALAALGAGRVAGASSRARRTTGAPGFWYRAARRVMARAVPVTVAIVAVLLVLGLPMLDASFGLTDHRMLPDGARTRETEELIDAEFSADAGAVIPVAGRVTGEEASVDTYATMLSGLPGVARVDAATGTYAGGRRIAEPGPANARFRAGDSTWLAVTAGVEPVSADGERLVKTIRATPSPLADIGVTGPAAALVDTKHSIGSRLPLAIVWIALATFGLLFLSLGSVLVSAKAVVLNFLSLTATFGIIVWIFQQGHLAGFLDFTATGTTELNSVLLLFCIAFGLSMDYEVFLLSRIMEEHHRGADNTEAVARGLDRTGPVVTAAAVLMAIVFGSLLISGLTFLKQYALGLTIAVLLDAFVIRATLVPAVMQLAGNANWWAPRPLRRLHTAVGLSEVDVSEPVPTGALAGVAAQGPEVVARTGAP
ncbi:MAG: MMPL family transporter [Actinomycetota bacterium]|jgi:putative drug exporter of the RND superfamily